MKKILLNIFFIFAFILSFVLPIFADEDLNISSVVYDNSNSMLVINSQDNDEYFVKETPRLYVADDNTAAYFDINSAVLKSPMQSFEINSDIHDITVRQLSYEPKVVRVQFNYNNTFNPKNIQLKQIGNTFVVNFKTPAIQNYYFQHLYSDFSGNVQKLLDATIVKVPIQTNSSITNQINSAFKLVSDTSNYVMSKKDLKLTTKYYLDNVVVKNEAAYISGMGSITVIKPIYLTSPKRVVYDIPNAIVNSSVRNIDYAINQTDSIKIGQFDNSTARVVITSENYDRYVPVFYSDSQKLAFVSKDSEEFKSVSSNSRTILSSVNYEKNDNQTQSLKLVFTKPIIYGLERTSAELLLYLYNVDKNQEFSLKQSAVFKDVKFKYFSGGMKIIIPAGKNDILDVHIGTDGKTLRIKEKLEKPIEAKTEEPVINVTPIETPKRARNGKHLVLIDPGHGGSDCGATRNGIYEKDINLDISNRVVALLKKKGIDVEMTRMNDSTVSLQERVEISENADPDIFVSIHVNSSNSESPKGIETHYYKDNSLQLAKVVHASMHNTINATDRGLFKSKFYVINHTTAPAILVEIGFISNPTERSQLVSEGRKQATAKAIAEGIYDYFK